MAILWRRSDAMIEAAAASQEMTAELGAATALDMFSISSYPRMDAKSSRLKRNRTLSDVTISAVTPVAPRASPREPSPANVDSPLDMRCIARISCKQSPNGRELVLRCLKMSAIAGE